MRAAILEHDPRAGHQVFDGARGEDFTGTRQSSDPRADVYRKAADVVAHPLALTGMNPGPDFEAGLAETIADRDGAAHGAGGPIERGEESVAGRADLLPAEIRELAPNQRVMLLQDVPPNFVAQR